MLRGGEAMKRSAIGALFALLLFLSVCWCAADGLFGFLQPPAETVAVPDLIGLDEGASGGYPFLDVTTVYRYDDSPAGTVLAQEPAAGSVRKLAGRTAIPLRLTVSLGRAGAEIPSLSGADARAAAGQLRALGFAVEEIRLPGGAQGSVDRTEPAAGVHAELGAVVRLYVWAGESVRTVAVPDLLGMTRGEALLTIFRSGLAALDESGLPADPGLVVASQTPTPGSIVTAGTAVEIVFGEAPERREA